MLTVYLVSGTVVAMPGAVSAEVDHIFGPGPREGLVCRTADGTVVGQFRLDQVAGFTTEGEPLGASHSGARSLPG